jgi:hypothetical protein
LRWQLIAIVSMANLLFAVHSEIGGKPDNQVPPQWNTCALWPVLCVCVGDGARFPSHAPKVRKSCLCPEHAPLLLPSAPVGVMGCGDLSISLVAPLSLSLSVLSVLPADDSSFSFFLFSGTKDTAVCVRLSSHLHLFGVFDGHGRDGKLVAEFVSS